MSGRNGSSKKSRKKIRQQQQQQQQIAEEEQSSSDSDSTEESDSIAEDSDEYDEIGTRQSSEEDGDGDGDDDDGDDGGDGDDDEYKDLKDNTPKKTNWSSTEISFRISGSLDDFSKNSDLAKSYISNELVGVFEKREGGADAAAATTERSKDHICGDITVTAIESDFPCAISLDLVGIVIPHAKKSFTNQGGSGVMTITPRKRYQASGDNGIPITSSVNDEPASPFLQNYPGWNLGNIHDGIQHLDDKVSMVRQDHPIINMFNQVRLRKNEKVLSSKDLTVSNYFSSRRKGTEECLDQIKIKMKEHLQIQDLYKMGISISRACCPPSLQSNGHHIASGVNQSLLQTPIKPKKMTNNSKDASPWLFAGEIFDGIGQASPARTQISSEPHNLYITLKVDYLNV